MSEHTTPHPTDPAAVAATYFEAWRANDPALLRTIVADEVHFTGPLAEVEGADAYADSIKGLYAITTDVVVEKVWVDGPDVITWFLLHTEVAADPSPVVNWTHVEDGLITRVRVTFDPRPLLPPQ